MSPSSDIVGPSPVTSNGTETTEIEDDGPLEPNFHDTPGDRAHHHLVRPSPTWTAASPIANGRSPQMVMLKTNLPDNVRRSGEELVSVIHAPEGFQNWVRIASC
jgi:hypothetical protein